MAKSRAVTASHIDPVEAFLTEKRVNAAQALGRLKPAVARAWRARARARRVGLTEVEARLGFGDPEPGP
ncbi:MAG: hypothetical protein ACFB2Z_05720 [Maricaulaceae bacterium]